ncbi:hypothetical protein NHX12_010297 [Muraenolepis orangiensis]|uniref:Inositol polyphosphate-related phosphatase domain-containing protein n=1 Tax=Muraenolepis orangiensis TaxID=630683 RepID=A0A9Q0I757_9TELE|nr:hypothetical protein NHX12_010297 [Muraenolepis orangiensis]
MFPVPCSPRLRSRSGSVSSATSQGSRTKMLLRQRLSQLLTCVEDMSSDEEAGEEMSRALHDAFQLCGRLVPDHAFRLHMVTWNVGTAEPPADVDSLLQLDVPVDLYVIGLQEVNSSPLRFISDMMVEDSWSHLLMGTLAPRGYIKGLLLLLFSKQTHVPFIRDIRTTYTRTGVFGYWGNKGGVSVRFSFYGHMLCFLNCHLAAHMNQALQRVDEFEVVFWFGDLNFRIADHGLHFLRSSINGDRFNLLWQKDQLMMMKKKEAFLQEFDEGPLSFKPSYKFDRNGDTYDTSGKKRKPAWTDRILWRIKPQTPPPEDDDDSVSTLRDDGQEEYPIQVHQDIYTSDMSYGVSDHKPVIASFRLELRKKSDRALVHVSPEDVWSADGDAALSYTVQEDFLSSTWDWIGLYKVGFKSSSDYDAFIWVRDIDLPELNEVIQITWDKDQIPLMGGEYVLGYISTNLQSLVGLSENFQIMESKRAVMEGLVPENINGLNQ